MRKIIPPSRLANKDFNFVLVSAPFTVDPTLSGYYDAFQDPHDSLPAVSGVAITGYSSGLDGYDTDAFAFDLSFLESQDMLALFPTLSTDTAMSHTEPRLSSAISTSLPMDAKTPTYVWPASSRPTISASTHMPAALQIPLTRALEMTSNAYESDGLESSVDSQSQDGRSRE